MNTSKQILMMMAAVVIAATTIFAGCKKDKNEVKVSGVEVKPAAVMISVGSNVTISAFVEPQNADDRSVTWTSDNTNIATVSDGVVTSHAVGEVTITCKTNDGGHTATTTVFVNPIPNEEDYATLVPMFYVGDLTMGEETAGENKLITVKYNAENKVMLSIDEKFRVEQMGMEVPMKVDCIGDLTKVENGYNVEGTTTMTIMAFKMAVTINGIFYEKGLLTWLDLNINVELPPEMGGTTIIVNFKGKGDTGELVSIN